MIPERFRPGSSASRSDFNLALIVERLRQDCTDLALSMAELAHGDLTRRLALQAQPVDPSAYPHMRELADALNKMVSSLHETADGFNELTETPCDRLCYVGADSFVEGSACGDAMGEAVHGSGQVAVVTTFLTVSGPELRRKGFMSALHDRFPGVHVTQVVEGTENREEAYRRTKELLQRNRQLKGLYVTVGATPHEVARAVVDAGLAGQIVIITHDLVQETMGDVKAGIITATLGQDPFAQGYEPVIHLFNHLAGKWTPPSPRLLTHRDLVTRNNWRDFWDDTRGIIESNAVAERRTAPFQTIPSRSLRIAVIGRDDARFWEPVRDGVFTATERLKNRNTSVDWLVPNADQNGFISAKAHGALLDSLREQGYDAIASPAFSKEYIPYINRAVAAGIPVVTFNTEPISLRALVAVIMQQAEQLFDYSQQLDITSASVSGATQHINQAMNQVSQGSVLQNDQIARTHGVLNTLLESFERVSKEAKQGASAAETASRAAQAGNEAVVKTRDGMKGIESAVSNTAQTVDGLRQESDKIDKIVKLISGIAYQIKLLGINAAIEAAHAGRYGAGFLVVAGEIRSLAERTSRASLEITELIESVKGRISEVDRVMHSTLERVSHGRTLSEAAESVLVEVRTAVGTNLERLAAITSAISEMQAYSNEASGAMENVASVSEQNAAAVEEVTASTEEMSSQLTEVTNLAHALARMAETTRELLAKFKLKDDA